MTAMRPLVAFLAAFMLTCGVVSADDKASAPPVTKFEKDLAVSCNRFGFKLLNEIVKDQPGDANIFISPLSISYALAMTLNGADDSTYDAITSTLELSDFDSAGVNSTFHDLAGYLTGSDTSIQMEIANSIWYRTGLPVSDNFINASRDHFGALIQGLDFSSPSAAGDINAWVDEKTHGKIKDIVQPPIDPSTIMYLINAVYFKGDWTTKFQRTGTKVNPFYPAEGKETTCHMMFMTNEFDYAENDYFQSIRLPYGKKEFAMLVFLPQPGVSVDQLVGLLNDQSWSQWKNGFINIKVSLGLPRFKFESEYNLNKMLSSLGMGIAFDPARADFKKMLIPGEIPDRNIFIDKVKHKTFLRVDEEGSEAAAVTSVTMALTEAAPMPIKEMIVNRPFLFAITEKKSGTVIFIGKVVNPVWEE